MLFFYLVNFLVKLLMFYIYIYVSHDSFIHESFRLSISFYTDVYLSYVGM